MSGLRAAFWAEGLKARRSLMPVLSAAAFLLLPAVGGLFMIILRAPEWARATGLISTKARLVAGVADWSAFFGFLAQGAAVGGGVLFAIITAWVFGREFADHTVKELLAVPTARGATVAAKFSLVALWILALTLGLIILGLGIGAALDLPGWSADLGSTSVAILMAIGLLNFLLMPFVALFASAGRGYLPAIGWAVFTVVFAQISAVLGWGDWFPWAVPALFSGMVGARGDVLGPNSYVVVAVACIAGAVATWLWWRDADQSR
jgi:ABC-2 type transport system permease protein